MSYNPPRAPVPPMIPPYGYGMPPMGMPPMMHPGMPMPSPMGMPSIRTPTSNTTSVSSTPGIDAAIKAAAEKPPTTTVFVGNISDRVPDPMIRQMLQRCGTVITWKRAQGANGKLQAFGFCEYDSPESTLRCIRLLNDYEIADKKITVKVDQKTKELLIEYKKKKRKEMELSKQKKPTITSTQQQLMRFNLTKRKYGDLNEPKEEQQPAFITQTEPVNNNDLQISLETVDEDSLKEDRITINAFEAILKQYSKELSTIAVNPTGVPLTTTIPTPIIPTPVVPVSNTAVISAPPIVNKPTTDDDNSKNDTSNGGVYMKPHLRLEEIQLDADKKDIITTEIQQFREKHKGEDVKIKKEEKERMERVIEREKQREKRSKSKERDNKERDRRDRDRDRDRERERDTRDRKRSKSRSKSPVVSRSPARFSRNNSSRNERDRERDRERSPPITITNPEELEELQERKRLERKLREKEAAYRERLKQWESREEKRSRQYEIEKQNEITKRRARLKEGKKLKQFLEDYDDEKDDVNYYKGSNLAKKLKLREKEIEMDNRDRQREKEEIDELKEKITGTSLNDISDIEAEIRRIQDDENSKMRIKYENEVRSSSSSSSESSDLSESEHEIEEQNTNKENDDKYTSYAYNDNYYKERERIQQSFYQENERRYEDDNKIDDDYNIDYYKRKNNEDIIIDNDKKNENNNNNNNRNTNDMEIDNNSSNEDNYESPNSLTNESKSENNNLIDVNLKKDMLSPSLISDDTTNIEQQQQQQQHQEFMDQHNNPTYDISSPSAQSQSSSMNQSPSINDLSSYGYALNPSLSSSSFSSLLLPTQQPTTVTIKKQMSKSKQQPSIKPKNSAFADDDDDEQSNSQQNKRLRITEAQLSELEKKQKLHQQQLAASKMNPEERKNAVKKLVESIPVDLDKLFNFNIDWDQLDQSLMEKRVKPWINRKIVEYIGEEEATLTEFICTQIVNHVKPDKILEDVKVILDEEAELFVKKMWRLIVYETESKRLGLSK